MYDNKYMDVVDNFIYLGITLYFNGNFHKTQNVLASQSKKQFMQFNIKNAIFEIECQYKTVFV